MKYTRDEFIQATEFYDLWVEKNRFIPKDENEQFEIERLGQFLKAMKSYVKGMTDKEFESHTWEPWVNNSIAQMLEEKKNDNEEADCYIPMEFLSPITKEEREEIMAADSSTNSNRNERWFHRIKKLLSLK